MKENCAWRRKSRLLKRPAPRDSFALKQVHLFRALSTPVALRFHRMPKSNGIWLNSFCREKNTTNISRLTCRFRRMQKLGQKKIKAIFKVDGPLSPYADKLTKAMDDVLAYEEFRNYAAHGLLVRPDPNDYSLSSKLHLRRFKMFKEGKLEDASRTLTLKQYIVSGVAAPR